MSAARPYPRLVAAILRIVALLALALPAAQAAHAGHVHARAGQAHGSQTHGNQAHGSHVHGGQGHAAHAGAGRHGAATHADHGAAGGPAERVAALGGVSAGDEASGTAQACPCCAGTCACPLGLLPSAGPEARRVWRSARRILPAPAAPLRGAAPEILPEPPRSFA